MEENIDNKEELLEVDLTNNSENSQEMTENVQEEKEQEVSQVDEKQSQLTEAEIQERIDKAVKNRLKQERRKNERDNKSLYQIEETLRKGLGTDDRNEILSKLQEFYDVTPVETNQKDEEFLGKAYANEIIDSGDIQEIEDEANRLASIPRDKRTVRENAMFNILCQKLVSNRQENELKEKGVDTKILLDSKFNAFREKLNSNVSIIEAVEMYNKLNTPQVEEPKKEKPASPGSAKTKGTSTEGVVKEFYTFEEAKNFTKKDFDKNPKLFKAVRMSMPKW